MIRARDAELPLGRLSGTADAVGEGAVSFSEGSGFTRRDQRSDVRDQTSLSRLEGLTSRANAHLTSQCK